jgi:Ni2+-binding GTPase involved in maturation of urease and hydrogenase
MSPSIRLVLVGGFLGAGKTTLLWEAARRLRADGRRVGLVTNDQAPDLVDTAWLAAGGFEVAEVAGSCFCCDFRGFVNAVEQLRTRADPEIVLAEPVGSCTDLSATILQPLKARLGDRLVPGPLSVIVDAVRLGDALEPDRSALHPSAAYILRKQLEEADGILVGKADTLDAAARAAVADRLASAFPGRDVRFVSSVTGENVEGWLAQVLGGTRGGTRLAAVDYDVYAEGEAVLGWLNARVRLRASAPVDWGGIARRLLEAIAADCARRAAAIGHVKLTLKTPSGHLAANLVREGAAAEIRGGAPAAETSAEMVVNARVQVAPVALERIVRDALDACAAHGVAAEIAALRSLSPGRPRPTHRHDRVVA